MLRNFKGVKEVGKKHYRPGMGKIENNRNTKPDGDTLGHTHVLEWGLKFGFTELPLFEKYQIKSHFWTFRPFIFANLAILPNDFTEGKGIVENIKENSVASTGLGLQFIHHYFTTELYYSVAVHKHDYEFGAELQFNFGLD